MCIVRGKSCELGRTLNEVPRGRSPAPSCSDTALASDTDEVPLRGRAQPRQGHRDGRRRRRPAVLSRVEEACPSRSRAPLAGCHGSETLPSPVWSGPRVAGRSVRRGKRIVCARAVRAATGMSQLRDYALLAAVVRAGQHGDYTFSVWPSTERCPRARRPSPPSGKGPEQHFAESTQSPKRARELLEGAASRTTLCRASTRSAHWVPSRSRARHHPARTRGGSKITIDESCQTGTFALQGQIPA